MEWLEHTFSVHPRVAALLRGPWLSVICLIVCLLTAYGREYLMWPEIHAEILRVELHPKLGLVPVGMMDELQRAAGKDSYAIDCDLMAEVYLVNVSQTAVTIRDFVGSFSVKSRRNVPFAKAKDFGGYTLKLEDKIHHPGSFSTVETTYTPLKSLVRETEGVALLKGVGYRGWLGFTAAGVDRKEAEQVKFNLHIVDALGHKHPIIAKKARARANEDAPTLIGPIDG